MTTIHPLSNVQSNFIGHGTKIWQYTIVLPNAVIGNECNINAQCFIENNVFIGNNVTIKCGVQVWDGITLEDDVFVGPNVTFTNDLLPRSKNSNYEMRFTKVKKGASIGANATILAGLTIGEYAMIGAGSVVTKDIPPFTLWVGNPAKQIATICKCGEKLLHNKCLKCKI
jgi:acetyltransferase-like isoleucine patch superfamily enzyme